jgi:hypothetical protein
MHVRQLVEAALKRRLLDARVPANDLVRLVRAALLAELREREADGLRPRVRALGGGQYAASAIERKLDGELAAVERELGERLVRLREATRGALRKKLSRLSPPAFETFGRALAEKMGLRAVELVRRGEGVAYFGGQLLLGLGSAKVLLALRPGEVEINRRAVGELRAGLAARGFDLGWLFAAGRAAAEALTELRAGPGVTAYDGAALAQLSIEHGLGVRRALAPVDYLDLDFFSELGEG